MFVFVILHYMSLDVTVECVNRIFTLFEGQSYQVIIVDNGSTDGSGAEIESIWKEKKNVTVILNEHNLGFARGNNVGYEFARTRFFPDYIIIMNNDILITDADFLLRIRRIYDNTLFHVLGPDIFSVRTGMHQNPVRLKGYSLDELQKTESKLRYEMKLFPTHYIYVYCKEKTKKIIKKILRYRLDPGEWNSLAKSDMILNPVLHGACYIFSKAFIENEALAFNDGTFLYYEEDILHSYCMEKGYKMVYDSSMHVNHIEDVSTDAVCKSNYEKSYMKLKYSLESLRVLIEMKTREDIH